MVCTARGARDAVSPTAMPHAVVVSASTTPAVVIAPTATSFAPTDGGVVISMDVAPGAGGRLFFGTTSNRTCAYDPAKGGLNRDLKRLQERMVASIDALDPTR